MNNEHREIERKYLVKSDIFKSLAVAEHDIRQGYLCADGIRTVRVRLLDETGFLTIKGRGNGVSRYEWEKEISRQDALELLALCHPGRVEKTRYIVPLNSSPKVGAEVSPLNGETGLRRKGLSVLSSPAEGYPPTSPASPTSSPPKQGEPERVSSLRVEVDVFHGDNEGLVFAEIELPSEDFSPELPDWLGKEVTGDPRYYNSYISSHPYCQWKEKD